MKKTLLIVDDAAIVRERIEAAARKAGWQVVGEAINGREAVERYAALRPSVVTLDPVMPEYDGLYAIREILALDPAAKVIAVGTLGPQNVLRDAFRLGAVDFVVKPFDERTLIEALEQAVTSPFIETSAEPTERP